MSKVPSGVGARVDATAASRRLGITDLTRPIFEGMEVADFYTPTMMWHNEAHDERSRFRGMTWASLSLVFSEHGLTHVESMRHLSPSGAAIDEIPVSRF